MSAPAALRLLAAALSVGLFAIAGVAGQLLPLPRPHTTDPIYYFVVDTRAAAVAFAAGVAIVGALGLLLRDTRRLLPLCWTAPLALGIVAALPNIGSRAAPLAYFLYDLRWYWIALISIAVISPVLTRKKARDSTFQVPRVPDVPRVPGVLSDVSVFCLVVIWAIATMPLLRFTGHIHGDEPKYMRYAETLYQGQGFDVDAKKPLSDFGADAGSRLLANLPLLGKAMAQDAHELGADLAAFVRDPWRFRWNRATPLPNWFLLGKHGTPYQVHTPGLSFLLLPGYFIDRHLLSYTPGYQGEIPAELVMTNVVMLTFCGLTAVALFHLLCRATRSAAWSAAGAIAAMITLPSTSFAFQLYPEMPAAFIVLAVTSVLIFQSRPPEAIRSLAPRSNAPPPWLSMLAGAATSYLVWLHPRFLMIWIAFVLLGLFVLRGRARSTFILGAAAVMFTFCAFAYHLTGSWLPTAMYDADPDSNAFVWSIIPVQVIANLLDRTWGVVPHAPLLLALPAGVIVLWRHHRGEAVAFVAIFLALLIPTASHGLSAAGATPGRQFMAVIPLAFWPLTRLAMHAWPSLARRAVIIVLAVLSFETALNYNLVHEKAVGRFVGASASGWRPNIAFPLVHTEVWEESAANFMLFLAWLALIAAATWWLSRRESSPEATSIRNTIVPLPAIAITIFTAVVLGTASTAAAVDRTRDDYLPAPGAARKAIAQALVDVDRCRWCSSSSPGRVDWWLFGPNPMRGVSLGQETAGRDLRLSLNLVADPDVVRTTEAPAYGRMQVDFGDGTRATSLGVVESRVVTHRYPSAGRFVVTVAFQLPSGDRRVERLDVVISP